MKYVVYQDSGNEVLVMFPRTINHDRMAEALEALRFGSDRDWHRRQGEIVSAGFVVDGHCSGSGETLGIRSRPEIDTKLLAAQQAY